MATKTISISDFSFTFISYGLYGVVYTSPVTGKTYAARTNNMQLIDATKNSDNPKRSELEVLRRCCKLNGGIIR